jgi:hypothetical protein
MAQTLLDAPYKFFCNTTQNIAVRVGTRGPSESSERPTPIFATFIEIDSLSLP